MIEKKVSSKQVFYRNCTVTAKLIPPIGDYGLPSYIITLRDHRSRKLFETEIELPGPNSGLYRDLYAMIKPEWRARIREAEKPIEPALLEKIRAGNRTYAAITSFGKELRRGTSELWMQLSELRKRMDPVIEHWNECPLAHPGKVRLPLAVYPESTSKE